jgi:hypothetical protein
VSGSLLCDLPESSRRRIDHPVLEETPLLTISALTGSVVENVVASLNQEFFPTVADSFRFR